MHRRALLVTLFPAMLGCAPPPFKPLEFSPPVPLQDPLPGLGVVYLMRAPHDREAVAVYFNSSKVASLPPESYTALSLRPGTYAISTAPSALPEEASVLTVAAGERRFLYTAIPTKGSSLLFLAPAGRLGFLPLVLPSRQATGARFWRECSEPDAQGLLSISRVVLPEQNAL